jgi:hypothetical protein
MFCRSLLVLLSFFFWPLRCLSFFDLRILITPLVSSNSFSPLDIEYVYDRQHEIHYNNKKEFEDTKGVIRIRKSKKDRQHNGQKKKNKRTNNDLRNIHIKLLKLKSSLRKFYGRHHDLVDRYRKYVVKMTTDMFHLSSTLPLSTAYAGVAGMLLHINGKFTMGKLKSSLMS